MWRLDCNWALWQQEQPRPWQSSRLETEAPQIRLVSVAKCGWAGLGIGAGLTVFVNALAGGEDEDRSHP